MKYSYKNVIQGVLIVSLGSVTVFLYLYWPQYLHQYMNYDFATLMRVNTASTLILNITIIFGGLLADKIGYRNLFMAGSLFLMVFTYPLFLLFNLQSMVWVIVSYIIFSLIFGFIPSSYSSILSRLFPTPVRYSGVAMSYNLAYAFFGGLSPVICTLAIHAFDSIMAPAFYVIFIAILSSLACYYGRDFHAQKEPETALETTS
jgi:MHS family proline/betaine transporter-like MFS transporter